MLDEVNEAYCAGREAPPSDAEVETARRMPLDWQLEKHIIGQDKETK